MVIHPPFAWQQGPLTFILSLALPFALIVLSSLRFSSTMGFRAFAMRSPLWGRVCVRTRSDRRLISEPLLQDPSRWVTRGLSFCTMVLSRSYGRISWFCGFQVPSGWGHPFRVESAVRTRSQLKVFLGMRLWRHIAVPPPLFNVGTRVLYINHSGNVY